MKTGKRFSPEIRERSVTVPTQAGALTVYAVDTDEQTLILQPSIFADRAIHRRIILDPTQHYRVIVVGGTESWIGRPETQGDHNHLMRTTYRPAHEWWEYRDGSDKNF
jgi:hypothetical protein